MGISGGKWVLSSTGGSGTAPCRVSSRLLCSVSGRLNFLGHFYSGVIKIPGNEVFFRQPVLILVPCELTLQCWDTTAEGPRGPACGGTVKSQDFCIK